MTVLGCLVAFLAVAFVPGFIAAVFAPTVSPLRRTGVAISPERELPRMLSPLVYPMAAHVALATTLYVALTVARAPVVWGIGADPDGRNPLAAYESRIGANLSNQFEWPLFFHVACLLALQAGVAERSCVVLAWIFVGGRLLHSAVQIFTTNIRLRGLVFTVNFSAVLGLWGMLLYVAGVGHVA